MNKKMSLADALHEASGKKIAVNSELSLNKEIEKKQFSTRYGKKVIAGHFDLEVNRQLKQIALNHNANIQSLLTEALNDLFIKYNTKPIA